MSNPLDVAHGFGKNDVLLEVLEELRDLEDPLVIILMCEQIDEDEGCTAGATLEQWYIARMTKEK